MSQEYSIAAGWNNAAGLTVIEDLTDGTDNFYTVRIVDYERGIARNNADGTRYLDGLATVRWQSIVTHSQLEYLQSNFEGKVTIRTRLYRQQDYANYNAVLLLDTVFAYPRPRASEVTWTFRRLEAL